MGNRKTFQRLIGIGVVFAMSLGLFSEGVGHFNRYATEAAVKNLRLNSQRKQIKLIRRLRA